jgi:hypothetical protein
LSNLSLLFLKFISATVCTTASEDGNVARSDEGNIAVGSDDGSEESKPLDLEMSCEPEERYDTGEHYPIFIGDVLANRYRIEHKLGFSGFSTV